MTLGSHQRSVGESQDWITPRFILEALGHFDLDPCASWPRPWHCADHSFTRDGLQRSWQGRVWLNPPFDRYQVGQWIARLAAHNHGTALLHVRTEAAWFEPVWMRASAILFLADRIYFHYSDGRRAEANSGAPVCLATFGQEDAEILRHSGLIGYLVEKWKRVP